jgi:hypothetical protein
MPRSLDRWFQDIIIAEKRKRMRRGVNQQINQSEAIRTGIHRIPSKSEANAQSAALALKPLHHYVFCSHNVPYWRTCTKCGRDSKLAERNATMILGKASGMTKP